LRTPEAETRRPPTLRPAVLQLPLTVKPRLSGGQTYTPGHARALAPLTNFDRVLVDDGLPPGELRRVRDLGVEVQVVAM
jgi:hypothetical protein